jgi:RND superfamily putative drug exporter
MHNLAARVGRWSASHWKTAVLGWSLFVTAFVAVNSVVKAREASDAEQASGNSKVAAVILQDAGFPKRAGESVIIQHPSARVSDPAFQAVIREVAGTLGRLDGVTELQAPLGASPQAAALVSKDGHSALLQFQIPGDDQQTKRKVEPIMAAVAGLQRAHPGYVIAEFGDASANHDLDATLGKDFNNAERLTLPLVLVILVIAFGALIAAAIPVIVAFTAVLATYGISTLVSHLVPGEPQTTNSIILLIGMAVGVDYSLFYLRREREEVAAGRDRQRALRIAAATSGQAVLISGATVLIAMAGMLMVGDATFSSIGVGTMLVVFVAMLGSVTVLPALLARFGGGVDRGRIPFLGRWLQRRRASRTTVWDHVVRPVLRRPLLAASSATLALLLLALPAFGLRIKLFGLTDLPKDLPIVKTYDRIQAAFPGSSVPAVVAIKAADVTTPEVRAAIEQLHRQAVATGQMSEPVDVQVNPSKTVAVVSIPLRGDGTDNASMEALDTLRTKVVPATVGKLAGAQVGVTGETAGTRDFIDQMRARVPLVFGFVLGFAFLLLLVSFRSVMVPLKAVLLNLLSVGASYGILVAVFQHGWGASLLGVHGHSPIVAWLPLFLFVVLFGLSMDYHVFILSRVKEQVDRGVPTIEAVSRGIRATAGTVTSAAVVMVGVFAVFGTLRTIDLKEAGVGLAAAVLLDATIIRAVLLPAAMALLGEWNWYLPRWLQWLPRVGHGAEVVLTESESELAEGVAPAPVASRA